MKRSIPILLVSVLLALGAPAVVLAQEFVPLEPIPGVNTGGNINVPEFAKNVFRLLVSAAAILAVLMLTVGGIQYMTSEALGTKEAARTRIKNALYGLIILIASYLILYTINPCLLEFRLFSQAAGSCAGGTETTAPANNAPASSAPTSGTRFDAGTTRPGSGVAGTKTFNLGSGDITSENQIERTRALSANPSFVNARAYCLNDGLMFVVTDESAWVCFDRNGNAIDLSKATEAQLKQAYEKGVLSAFPVLDSRHTFAFPNTEAGYSCEAVRSYCAFHEAIEGSGAIKRSRGFYYIENASGSCRCAVSF